MSCGAPFLSSVFRDVTLIGRHWPFGSFYTRGIETYFKIWYRHSSEDYAAFEKGGNPAIHDNINEAGGHHAT